MRRLLLATVAGALVLAGCSSSAKPAFVAQTTTFDDGALTITTAPLQKTPVTQAAAEFDLAHSDVAGYGWAQKQVEFGYVTVKPSAMQPYNPGDAVPAAPSHQLSWVLFFIGGKSNCGTEPPNAPTPTYSVAHPSRQLALIVDAATGTGLSYEGAGSGNCISISSPRVMFAGGNVSVPWTDSGSNYVTATYPPCVAPGEGTPGESDQSGSTFAVIGFRFFTQCHAKATVAKVPVNFPRPWKHSALGPVPTGTSG
jgi:hypothetical protein